LNKFIFILLIIVCFNTFTSVVYAQSDLVKAEKELKEAKNLLESLGKQSSQTLTKYNILKKQIQLQDVLITKLQKEILKIESEILINSDKKKLLQTEIKKLKSEYEELIFYAYKTRKSRDKTMYILSSKSFNQAYRRFVYLQYLTEYIEQTTTVLNIKNDSLSLINENLMMLKDDKLILKEKQTNELIQLNSSKVFLSEMLSGLESRKEELMVEVNRKEKIANSLRESIQKNISSEKSIKKSKTTEEFELNKGRLPFPLKGIITSSFGTHTHSVLKNVQVNNDGIEIAAASGEQVKCVYKGKVTQVLKVPGSNNAVLIKHGQYYTVYSNLSEVFIKTGDDVKQGALIGTPDSRMLNFQIWFENQKLNPQLWLK
jgi:murein DD-endopeptidase MepM/ murein hydrolase activator NlpD